MSIHINEVAAQLGVDPERVVRTLVLGGIPHMHNVGTDDRFVTEFVAEQLASIYRNTATMQAPRPTPQNLREEYTRDEQKMIISTYGHNTELW